MTWKFYVAAGVALVAAFAFGRYSAPRALERDHIVTSERDTELSFRAYVGHTVTVSSSSTRWRTVTKWEPSGEVVQVREAEKQTASSTTRDTASENAIARDYSASHEETHERKPLQPAPDWFATARAGVDVHLSPIYGASISRRVLGPVYVEAWGQRPWAGGLGVGLAF